MFGHYVSSAVLLVGGQLREDKDRVRLQWCNQFWQNLEEGAGKRCSECVEVGGGEEKWPGGGGGGGEISALRWATMRAILILRLL